MIIVLADVRLQPGREAGCVSHDVFVDPREPQRLQFVERWSGAETLGAHVQLGASRAFGKALAAMAATPPVITLFDARELPWSAVTSPR